MGALAWTPLEGAAPSESFPCGLPEQALPGSCRHWQREGFREMYILINEGAFMFDFCSLFLAVGDSSFPSQQPDMEQRDAGFFLYL